MSLEDIPNNSWSEYRRLVIAELERLDGGLLRLSEKHDSSVANIRSDLHSVKNELTKGLQELRTAITDDNDSKIDELEKVVRIIGKRVDKIQTTAAIYGALAGGLLAAAGILIPLFFHH